MSSRQLVPEDSWVFQLALHGHAVEMTGHSPHAADMISRIEGSALFEKPRFRSPITLGPDGRSEQFSLSFDVNFGRGAMTTLSLSIPVRRLLAVSILSPPLYGTWSVLVWPLVELAADRQSDIAALSDELDHLRSIAARRPVLERTAQRLRGQLAEQASNWKGSSPAAIAASMQILVRQTIAASGGQLKSTSEATKRLTPDRAALRTVSA